MEPNISYVATLIGDKARSRMLTALLGGKALTATELSLEADITSQTASSHLAKLVEGQLLVVRKQGRHKYFQLKNMEVAALLESLLNISSQITHPKVFTGPQNSDLRKSRICYDHLAGELGVALYDSLIKNDYIRDEDNDAILTDKGSIFFREIGFGSEGINNSRRPLCKSCLDWSERKNHLAGVLGQWILATVINKGWALQDMDSRIIRFTNNGLKTFYKTYNI